MEINVIGKEGSLTRFEIITDDREAAKELIRSVTTYFIFNTKNGVECSASKSDVLGVKSLVSARNSESKSSGKLSGRRVVAALSYAKMKGLNHGRSWLCSDYDIEVRGVCPSLEGEMICYVYQ